MVEWLNWYSALGFGNTCGLELYTYGFDNLKALPDFALDMGSKPKMVPEYMA